MNILMFLPISGKLFAISNLYILEITIMTQKSTFLFLEIQQIVIKNKNSWRIYCIKLQFISERDKNKIIQTG